MLLSVLLPAILITMVQAAPTLHAREDDILSSDTYLAFNDISPTTDVYSTESSTTADSTRDATNYSFSTEPLEIADATPTKPPQGFRYSVSEGYDGYCLTGYSGCKVCQKGTGCFPAKRSSFAKDGKIEWQLCETDVSTPPCIEYDTNKVFTESQLEEGQKGGLL